MIKTVEYQVGLYASKYPLMLKFHGNEDQLPPPATMLELSLQVQRKLGYHFGAYYQAVSARELHYPSDKSKFIKGRSYRVVSMSGNCNFYDKLLLLTAKSLTFVKYERVGDQFDELHFVDNWDVPLVFMLGEAVFAPIE